MGIQAIGNMHFGNSNNLIQNLGMLAITIIALNAIQGIQTANADFFGTICAAKDLAVQGIKSVPWIGGKVCYGISWGFEKAGDWVTPDHATNIIDAVSKYGTFKYVADKVCDASFLAAPQFAIPFRIAMTAGSLGMEWLTCNSASDAYLKCTDQQIKVLEKCDAIKNNSKITAMNRKVSACTQMTDTKAKDACITKAIDNFNEQSSKKKRRTRSNYNRMFNI